MDTISQSEQETFLRVWQRVAAPAEAAPAPPPSPVSWQPEGFLRSALEDNARRLAMCRGCLSGLCRPLQRQQRRLRAAWYLLTGECYRPVEAAQQADLTSAQLCRRMYQAALTARSAFEQAAKQDRDRQQLWLELERENGCMAQQVQQMVEGMM